MSFMLHVTGFQPLILDSRSVQPISHPESIIQHMSEQEQRLAVLHLISGLSDGSLGCVDGRSGESDHFDWTTVRDSTERAAS